ncbi:MAG: aldehyde dehydrogenase family protein [Solirubrobacteraceae bacterium]
MCWAPRSAQPVSAAWPGPSRSWSGAKPNRTPRATRSCTGAARLRTGAGLDPATDVCPLVSREARERVVADIDQAEADGVTILLDGRGDPGPGGCSLAPTILDDVPDGHGRM